MDKWIFACNNEDCDAEFIHIYVDEGIDITRVPLCPLCDEVMNYCETLEGGLY